MRTLMRKDWRLVASLLVATGILYAVPFAIFAVYCLMFPADRPQTRIDWLGGAASLFAFALMAASLTAPMYAAVMFARERRDRTSEFVATLPLSRSMVIASKAVVALAAPLLPWIVSVGGIVTILLMLRAPGGSLVGSVRPAETDLDSIVGLLTALGGGTILTVGAAWFFSAILKSETLAAGLALLCTVFVVTAIVLVQRRLGEGSFFYNPLIVSQLTAVLGAISFAGGYVVALRRASP